MAQRISKRERPPHFHPSIKTANCLHHCEGSQGENHSWWKQILGSLLLATTFTPQAEKSHSIDIDLRVMPRILPNNRVWSIIDYVIFICNHSKKAKDSNHIIIAITIATRMHLPPNLTWKWTLTDLSFSSSETLNSSNYSGSQYNDNTHTYRLASHTKQAASV